MKSLLFLKTFIAVRWLQNWQNRHQLTAYQQKRLAKQLAFFKKHSPYFQKHPLTPDFRMDKAFMMGHFDDLNTVGISKDKAFEIAMASEKSRDFSTAYQGISVGLSSGTSGNYGIFLTSPKEQAMWAASILAKLLPKGHLFGHRIAFFLRSDNNLYQSVNSFLIQLRYFDMQRELEEHLSALEAYQPTLLVAPASVLLQIARQKKAGLCQIQPQKIVSVAEILEEKDCQEIAAAFDGQVIHQVYQATEGFLATSCQYGVLHLNEDSIYFDKEWIDDQRFYPIITDFKRESQPFVQYRLNDILHIKTSPCACGSVLQAIDKIEGRSDDIFLAQKLSGGISRVYPDFIRRCFLALPDLQDYRVKQLSLDELEVALPREQDWLEQEVREQFEAFSTTFQLRPYRLTFVDYQLESGKKLRRIQQAMPKEELNYYD